MNNSREEGKSVLKMLKGFLKDEKGKKEEVERYLEKKRIIELKIQNHNNYNQNTQEKKRKKIKNKKSELSSGGTWHDNYDNY